MNIPAVLHQYLAGKDGCYQMCAAPEGLPYAEMVRMARVPVQKLVRSVVLKDGERRVMVVYPATHRLDLNALNSKAKRNFISCSSEELASLFADCEPAVLPPLGGAFGLRVIIDQAVDALDEVFFNAGVSHLFIRTRQADFVQLTPQALRGHRIARPIVAVAAAPAGQPTAEDYKAKVERVTKLPPMPGIATEILRLRHNAYANASELAAVIDQDPSLAAQLLRYAASPFYGYQGKLTSVEQAIVRVLGMDFVMDFALGLSLGRSFRHSRGGPLGLDNFWRDALHAAAMTQALCNSIDYTRRPSAGVAYLAGLLHNFGVLLLGHLFPQQFERLNQAVAEQPERPLLELERELLGVTHAELGLWLAEAWNLPQEIVETIREHHNPAFRSEYSVYANLVYVANRLLKRFGMGDAEGVDVPADILREMGITEIQAEAALGAVLQGREGLLFMAQKMAA